MKKKFLIVGEDRHGAEYWCFIDASTRREAFDIAISQTLRPYYVLAPFEYNPGDYLKLAQEIQPWNTTSGRNSFNWEEQTRLAEETDLWKTSDGKYWIGVYPPAFTQGENFQGRWLTASNIPGLTDVYSDTREETVIIAEQIRQAH